MCEKVEGLIDGLFSELDRIAVGGRTLAAARVARTRAWFGSGAPSMAAWTASRTGSSLRQSSEVVAAATRLEGLPETREALASGKLSEAQLCEIAPAAAADPAAEPSLLELASRRNLWPGRAGSGDVPLAPYVRECA